MAQVWQDLTSIPWYSMVILFSMLTDPAVPFVQAQSFPLLRYWYRRAVRFDERSGLLTAGLPLTVTSSWVSLRAKLRWPHELGSSRGKTLLIHLNTARNKKWLNFCSCYIGKQFIYAADRLRGVRWGDAFRSNHGDHDHSGSAVRDERCFRCIFRGCHSVEFKPGCRVDQCAGHHFNQVSAFACFYIWEGLCLHASPPNLLRHIETVKSLTN